MNPQDDITPLSSSSIHSTQIPAPSANGGAAGGSGKRAGVPPSPRSLIPPPSPYSQIPTTRQPIASQNFTPGPMSQYSSPFFSYDSFPPPPPPYRDSPSALPPIPFARGSGSGSSGLPPRKAHRRANSDNIISGLNAMLAQNTPRLIYPKPIHMPVGVGVESSKEGDELSNGDDDDLERSSSDPDATDEQTVSKTTTTSGVKRRAGKEIATSTRLCRSVSMDTSLNDQTQPKLPPSPRNLQVTIPVRDDVFTEAEMIKIQASRKLKLLAASDPKNVKRILANRESAARSKEKKAQYMNKLENKVEFLQTQAVTMSSKVAHLERVNLVMENENRELRIRLQGLEQQAQLRDSLIGQLTGEVHRLKVATGEVVNQNFGETDGTNMQPVNANMQPVNANMFEQLNLNNQLHQPQTNPDFQ
ncbi:hypothetical protein EUTSA_v10000176mg [Eutrema salsugineum]|uniref:BZIP domain-containing protein n=1 Tax=Eutrema salsugineum TaxID=72664 RepID=V4NIG6_EUTSA|nr:transcription factor RF2a [Eutrema salsugineum]ESQ46016.1 hypothetical protein EUTSA_v10000176mg [Eutrema salsugineum]